MDIGFLPHMHAYNHNRQCQSKYSPAMILGIGIEDGEDCERAWSMLNWMSSQVAGMRNENFNDFICFAVESINEKMIKNIPKKLFREFKKTLKELNTLSSNSNLIIDSYDVVKSRLEISNAAIRSSVALGSERNVIFNRLVEMARSIVTINNKMRRKGKTNFCYVVLFF